MVIVKVKKLGNWALQIYAGEVITPRKVVFLAVLFITDDAQMVSCLVLLLRHPEDSSSNHGARVYSSTEIVIFYYIPI